MTADGIVGRLQGQNVCTEQLTNGGRMLPHELSMVPHELDAYHFSPNGFTTKTPPKHQIFGFIHECKSAKTINTSMSAENPAGWVPKSRPAEGRGLPPQNCHFFMGALPPSNFGAPVGSPLD